MDCWPHWDPLLEWFLWKLTMDSWLWMWQVLWRHAGWDCSWEGIKNHANPSREFCGVNQVRSVWTYPYRVWFQCRAGDTECGWELGAAQPGLRGHHDLPWHWVRFTWSGAQFLLLLPFFEGLRYSVITMNWVTLECSPVIAGSHSGLGTFSQWAKPAWGHCGYRPLPVNTSEGVFFLCY